MPSFMDAAENNEQDDTYRNESRYEKENVPFRGPPRPIHPRLTVDLDCTLEIGDLRFGGRTEALGKFPLSRRLGVVRCVGKFVVAEQRFREVSFVWGARSGKACEEVLCLGSLVDFLAVVVSLGFDESTSGWVQSLFFKDSKSMPVFISSKAEGT